MVIVNLDEKDEQILSLLRADSRASTQSIADTLGMPRVTVHDRIRRLAARGVVRRFTIEVDRKMIGRPLHGYILANWAGQRGDTDRRGVARQIAELEFVVGCHIVTGQWDFIVEFVARGMGDLGDAILDQLSAIAGVGHTQTLVSFYDYEGASAGIV
jgi:Lrp/AsnC family leucine-responsive transcriptional regulator